MSNWQAEQAERNRKSLARLTKALPAIFPPAVLARALSRGMSEQTVPDDMKRDIVEVVRSTDWQWDNGGT